LEHFDALHVGDYDAKHVTRHTSHVTRHTSHVTRHTSHVIRAQTCSPCSSMEGSMCSPGGKAMPEQREQPKQDFPYDFVSIVAHLRQRAPRPG
jgi:hypothetical protein